MLYIITELTVTFLATIESVTLVQPEALKMRSDWSHTVGQNMNIRLLI